MKTLCLLITLCLCVGQTSIAQFIDDFADGELASNPTWQGDTSHVQVNALSQLQLQAPSTSNRTFIATQSAAIYEASWEWWTRLAFNPSSANYVDVYLVSDRPELDSALAGYFVRIGNTTDEVSLYRQQGLIRTKIIDGADGILNKSDNVLRVKVQRNAYGWWSLQSDTTGNGTQYRTEGSVLDIQHGSSRYFGLRMVYSSTRANHFYFDDFVASGSPLPDTLAPRITQAHLVGDQGLVLRFNKILGSPNATILANYQLQGQGPPLRAMPQGDSAAFLEWLFPFQHPAWLAFEINLTDSAGNRLDTVLQLLHHRFFPGQVKINELLADPSPSVGLPESEMVELINCSPFDISLKNWSWRDGQTVSTLPEHVIPAGGFVLLVPLGSMQSWSSFGACIGLATWPSLNNEEDWVWLVGPDGRVSDSLYYSNRWLGTPARMEGGHTLERVEWESPCADESNWKGSLHPDGGTPAAQNSVAGLSTALPPPVLMSVRVLENDTLILQFSSAVGGGHIWLNDSVWSLQGQGYAQSWKCRRPALPTSSDSMVIRCVEVVDCRGQLVEGPEWTWHPPSDMFGAKPVFSEIYFRPMPGGTPYLELYLPGTHARALHKLWLSQRNEWGQVLQSVVLGQEGDSWSPGSFIVFCRDTALLRADFGEIPLRHRRQFSSNPGILTGGGWLTVETAQGEVLASTSYHDSLHHPMLHETRGRALEKVNGHWHSRWGSSQGNRRGTPGKLNSREISAPQSTSMVHLSRQIVHPHRLEHAQVTISSATPRLVQVALWSVEGRYIGEFMPQQLIEGNVVMVFDGHLGGTLLPTGGYFLRVAYFDLLGNKGSEVHQIVVNNLRP